VVTVNVTLVNDGTGFARVVTANGSGQFAACSVPAGAYTITVEHPGFLGTRGIDINGKQMALNLVDHLG